MTTAADTCYRHPDRLAVEHCETCHKPVCGACLWYAEAGQRLCPDHAADQLRAGQAVQPPERYAAGIAPSQASAAQAAPAPAPYQGNQTDLTALAAAFAGASALLACAGFAWLMPVVALVLGVAAWLQHRQALDPRRTQQLSLVGLAGGGVLVLAVAAMVILFSLCFVVQFALIARGGRVIITPIPTPLIVP